MNERSMTRLKVLMAGVFSLILMLGVARFAYTPMLPLMQQQIGLSVSAAGWLAAINYAGYLSGAVLASVISNLVLKDRLYRIGLIVAVLTTVGMGLTDNFWLWSALRFFAGLSSAAGLLLGSGLILNWLIHQGYRKELGIHFSGMGLGIVVGALVIELGQSFFNWEQLWFLLSVIGVIILIPAWRWLPSPDKEQQQAVQHNMKDNPPGQLFLYLFMLMYFCAGVGYVISATFISAIVEQLPGLEGKGSLAFLVLGLAAAPACIVWDLVARRLGDLNTLIVIASLNILGILLPAITTNVLLVMLGAALFGATFIGIVSLVLTMAGRYYPSRPAKMMGKMTITYGIAQIVGPALIGLFAKEQGAYLYGLIFAAGLMAIGVLLLVVMRIVESKTDSFVLPPIRKVN